MIKRVLVGTDTTAAADLAVDHAASLARSYDAELTVLYVRSAEAAREVFDPGRPADPNGYLARMPSRFNGLAVKTRTVDSSWPAPSICTPSPRALAAAASAVSSPTL